MDNLVAFLYVMYDYYFTHGTYVPLEDFNNYLMTWLFILILINAYLIDSAQYDFDWHSATISLVAELSVCSPTISYYE